MTDETIDPADAPVSRRVSRYAAGVAVVGVAVLVLVALVLPVDGPLHIPTLLFALIAVAGSAAIGIDFDVRSTGRTITMDEIGYGVALVLLPPAVAAIVAALGTAIEQLTRGREPIKALFNAGGSAISIGAAALLVGLVDAPPLSFVGVVAVLAGLWLNVAVNTVLFIGIVTRMSGGSGRGLVAREAAANLIAVVAVGGIGLLAAALWLDRPLLLPFLLAPALLAQTQTRTRQMASDKLASERDRLARAVEGVTDGVALLDVDGGLLLANESFRRLACAPGDDLDGGDILASLVAGAAFVEPSVLRPREASEAVTVAEGELHGHTVRLVRHVLREGRVTSGAVLQLQDVTRQREVEHLREDFVSRVSHELRTPLTSINGTIDTLQSRGSLLTSEQAATLLAVARRNGRRLERLVSSLLVRAQIEGPHVDLARRDVELAALVSSVLDDLPEVGASADVPAGVWVHVDPDHLRQMLENLLTNADRYGASPIVVRGRPDAAVVEIRVQDGGPGVPADFIARMFEPFTQASTGTRREAHGLGLGLDIVRSLAAANDGSIGYDRTTGGACFVIRLPAGRSVPTRRDEAVAG